jgi:hypothetical protein
MRARPLLSGRTVVRLSASLNGRQQGGSRMQAYRNLAGNSGVRAYQISRDGIRVRFANGATYLYDHRVPGKEHVEEMKRLAVAGRGLSTYIARFGGDYARKIK